MLVLVACEESQQVCIAFREKGCEAYSCDLKPCSGGHPEWYIQADIRDITGDGDKTITLQNGDVIYVQSWDMIIAQSYCTHTAVSGARWFPEKRKDGRQKEAINFFLHFTKLSCEMVAIEYPISIMSTIYRKPDQIIQPWMFGHGEVKATCLYLKGLPKLVPTNIVEGREARVHKMPPSKDRATERSKTLRGIAQAMAQQWGGLLSLAEQQEGGAIQPKAKASGILANFL